MTLVKDLGMQYPTANSKRKYRYGLYICPDCNSETKAQTTSVKRGQTKRCSSCGGKLSASKMTREQRIKHGDSGTRLHNIWNGMRDRCKRKKHPMFHHYGGKGVTVCAEWLDYSTFKIWSLRNGYSNELTIERKDNDGNYEPNNCKWATRKEQSNNQGTSVLLRFTEQELLHIQREYYTSKKTVDEYVAYVGISRSSLQKLLSGKYENIPSLNKDKRISNERNNNGQFKTRD